jgi:hypothetical protein
MTRLHVCLALLLTAPVAAFAWTYSPLMTVSELQRAQTFQHLESSGNRAIAISQAGVAVSWEDNRSAKPQVYIAFKAPNASQFSQATRVSDNGPAYEPAVVGLPDGRFLVAWEASGQIWSRIVSAQASGPVQKLSQQTAREVTVSTTADGRVWLAWAQKAGTHFHIVASVASVHGDKIALQGIKAVDAAPPKQDQLYPSIALTRKGITIGWEDRRYGHTRLFTAFAVQGKGFAPLRQLNYIKPWPGRVFGKGTGSMRVVLASDGRQHIVGCWLDKRHFVEGYDVYAALSHDGGKIFGQNEKVQDMLGANQAQWHAVSAMDNHGHAVIAWDDQRDGSPDIWMSWYNGSAWSDDDNPRGGSGAGSQSHPAMVFDAAGRLHLAFLDRADGKTAIRYLVATPSPSQFIASP